MLLKILTREKKITETSSANSEQKHSEKLSWPGWLTYSGRFTHISGHLSAVVRAQNSESSLVKDQSSSAAPRNQPTKVGRGLVM